MYCLLEENKLLTIKHFLSTHLKPWKLVIFCYFHNISRNCHFVTHFDIPKKLGRKCLIVTNSFFTNKQYIKIKLMQNETNLWSIFLGKGEILMKLWFKGINYHNFTFLIITNFKTYRYLNNFQEHLFGILILRKYQTLLQNFFPTWERGY